MRSTKSRLALAAALAVLATPALADEATCSVCADPTFPELERPAPALTLHGPGGAVDGAVEVDPTWPADAPRSPAVALVPQRVESAPAITTAGVPAATVRHVVVLGPSTRQVARAR